MKIINVKNDKNYYVIYKKGIYGGFTSECKDVMSGERLNKMFGDEYNDTYYILNFWEVEDEDK